MLNYYSLLKISPAAASPEINSSFEEFKNSLTKYNRNTKLTDEEIRIQCPEIWLAYTTLLDPEKRKEYDDKLKKTNQYRANPYTSGPSVKAGGYNAGNYKPSNPFKHIPSDKEEIYLIRYRERSLLVFVSRVISYILFVAIGILYFICIYYTMKGTMNTLDFVACSFVVVMCNSRDLI